MATQPPWEKYANAQPKAAVDDTAAWNSYAGVKDAPAAAEEAPQAPARTGMAESLHRAGVLARGLLTGPTSTVGMVGDALNTAINLGGRAIGHDPHLGMPTQRIQAGMTAAGLPQAETGTEKAVEGLAGIATGSRDPLMGAMTRGLAPASGPVISVRDQSINAGKRLGYMAPPDQQGGAVGSMLGTVAGRKPLVEAMKMKNQNTTDALARKIVGLPEGSPITEENVTSAMNATYDAGYKPIQNIGNITTGGMFRRKLDQIAKDNQGISNSFPDASRDDVKNLVDAYRVPNYNSADAIDAIKHLRTQSYNRMLDPTVRNASRSIAKALEDNIELNLTAMGKPGANMLSGFRDARTQLAKQNLVLNSIERGTGNVSLNKIASKGNQRGPGYLTDELKDMANFNNATSGVTSVPASTEQPFITSPLTNGFATLAAHVMGGPVAGGAVAGFPFGQHFLRSALMSQAGQKALQPRLDPRLLNQLLHKKGVVNAMPAAMQQSGLFGQDQQQ